MQNTYESPDVIQIGEAGSMILGTKVHGYFDTFTGAEGTYALDMYDIDE